MTRIDRMNDVFHRVFHSEPNAGEGNDPEMMQILQRFIFGEVFYTGNLDDQTRELITVTCLATLQCLPQLEAHVGAALNTGLEPLTIRETIYQLAPFIGFPRTLNALTAMNTAFETRGIPLPLANVATVTEDDRAEQGRAIQEPIYGTEIAEAFADLPAGMGAELSRFLTEFGFGDIATRPGLTLQQRELIILSTLAALRATPQITAHAKGNLTVGNSLETMIAAMIQCAPYLGFPQAFAAIHAIMEIERNPDA